MQKVRQVRHEGVLARVRADVAHYARAEGALPSLGFTLRMVLLTHGFQFVLHRRIGEALQAIPLAGRPLRRIWWWWTCRRFSSEIAIGAEVGGGLYIPHPFGIVIGAGRIGRDVAFQQNVTVGARDVGANGVATIGDGAYLASGAVIVGAISVGAGARIGANSVVLTDVPAGCTAVGAPARVLAPRTRGAAR